MPIELVPTPPITANNPPGPQADALRVDVDLLAAEVEQALFGTVTGGPGTPEVAATATATTPEHSLGRFALERKLGQGGMGVVYQAYDAELSRSVAIKLALSSPDIEGHQREEIRREATALAQLNHPNVVQVYEVGEAAGQVFIVMELVTGVPVSRWLRQQARSAKEVLEVFAQAARGLAAAHELGVVHCDFKPANMVLGDDGRVRVLDFGLAVDDRVVVVGNADGSKPKRRVAGTLPYMPPEQHRGDTVDARSDQFTFCASLYEALYGVRPFEGSDANTLHAAKMAGELNRPPRNRSRAVPTRVQRAIVRGLCPRPDDRFESMEPLIAAIAPRARNRGLWVVAGLAVGVAATTAWQGVAEDPTPCTGAQEHVADLWNETRQAEIRTAMTARGVDYERRAWSDTRAALDSYTTQWVQMHTEACEATAVHGEQSPELLDVRMACLDHRRLQLEATTGVLAEADADAVQHAHELVGALAPIRDCADIEALQLSVAPPDADEAEAVDEVMARMARVAALHQVGRFAEANEEIETARTLAEPLHYRPLHTRIELADGNNLIRLGKDEAAEAALRRALALAARDRQYHQMQDAAAHLVHVIGYALERPDEGLQHRELALALADGDPVTEAATRTIVASVLGQQARYDESELELRNALELQQGADEPDIPGMAITLGNLANLLSRTSRYEEALGFHRRAVQLTEGELGPDHPEVAHKRTALAAVLRQMGRKDEAEQQLKQALSALIAALGPEHTRVASARGSLAILLNEQGRHEESEHEHREATRIFEVTLGPDHSRAIWSRANLGSVLYMQGRYAEASELYERSVQALEESLGPDHPSTATLRSNYGESLSLVGRYEDAESELRRALTTVEDKLGKEHHYAGLIHNYLASALTGQGRLEAAEQAIGEALRILEAAVGKEHNNYAEVQVRMAELLLATDRAAQAIPYARGAWAVLGADDTPPLLRAEASSALARALHEATADPHARELARVAVTAWDSAGPAHSDRAERDRAWARQIGAL